MTQGNFMACRGYYKARVSFFPYVVIARKFVRTAGGFNLFFCAICGASADNFAAPAEKEAASPNKLPRLQFYLVNLFWPDLGSFIAWKGCYQTITSQSLSTRLKTIFMEIYCYCSEVIAFAQLEN
jgi:hypothetical protein